MSARTSGPSLAATAVIMRLARMGATGRTASGPRDDLPWIGDGPYVSERLPPFVCGNLNNRWAERESNAHSQRRLIYSQRGVHRDRQLSFVIISSDSAARCVHFRDESVPQSVQQGAEADPKASHAYGCIAPADTASAQFGQQKVWLPRCTAVVSSTIADSQWAQSGRPVPSPIASLAMTRQFRQQ